jgi:microcystin-dependent protein
VVQAATLALARAAMSVAGLGANTFTGAQTLPGNAASALEAVPKQQAESIATAAAATATPIGAEIEWPTSTVPSGWLECDGSLISRVTYASLFAVLVTTPGFAGQTFTVTIASPGVVTKAGHGFTGGELLRLSTTGALPTGLNTTDDFFVIFVDANTFRLATTEANAAAGTAINTSGAQSGVHTYTQSLYGLGDGATTFKLPDDRDVFLRGKAASGRAIGGYQADDNKAHTHSVEYTSGPLAGGAGGHMTPGTGSFFNTASTGATEARPKNRAYLPIIKYQ